MKNSTTNSSINKVFGIGLSKTGTTSLSVALTLLGIRTIDFPHDSETQNYLMQGKYNLPILDHYQAMTDTPAAGFYPHFDRLYPSSKFILTIRPDKEEWLQSVRKHWHRVALYIPYMKFIGASIYGCYAFSPERFAYVYDRHVQHVCEYFRERPQDLLVLNICGGEGWEKLCPFLDCEVPSVPFPWENAAPVSVLS